MNNSKVTSSSWALELSWQRSCVVYLFSLAWWQYRFDATVVNTQTHTHRQRETQTKEEIEGEREMEGERESRRLS